MVLALPAVAAHARRVVLQNGPADAELFEYAFGGDNPLLATS